MAGVCHPSLMKGQCDGGKPLRRPAYVALLALLLLSGAYFAVRGPYRAWVGTIDFHVFYSASRAWALGSDPYDQANLDRVFRDAGGVIPVEFDGMTGRPTLCVAPGEPYAVGEKMHTTRVNLSLNPPTTFVPIAPVALLPWSIAEAVWNVLTLLMVAATMWSLAVIADLPLTRERGLAFLALALALAPFHTSVVQGQMTIPVTALAVGALACGLRGRSLAAGVLLALATALKPQTAIAFLALPLLRMQWRTVLWSAIGLSALASIALVRMTVAGVAWLASYRTNLSTFLQGGQGDPTSANPEAYLMLNLQPLLHNFLAGRTLVTVITLTIVAAAAVVTLGLLRKRRDAMGELLLYSAAGVLGLLAFYNRAYGATVLVIPLAWAVAALSRRELRVPAIVMIVMIMTFVVPGTAIIRTLLKSGQLPFDASSAWWRLTIMLHQSWALIVLTGCMIWAAVRMRVIQQSENTRPN